MPPDLPDAPGTDLTALRDFVVAVTHLVGQTDNEAVLLPAVRGHLGRLIARDDWLPPALAAPHPQFYRQYLLHADPLGRFSVVSFVWGPGQRTPVHDHTVWGLIGLLRGAEVSQPFGHDAQGCLLPQGPPTALVPGQVEVVSPTLGDIHQVHNPLADQVSVSIHVYGANIGQVRRWVYAADGSRKPFVSGYANAWVPDLWGSGSGAASVLPVPRPVPTMPAETVRAWLRQGRELALLDMREEDPFAQAHPLWAAQMPVGRLPLDAAWRLPRRDVTVVLYDDGEGLAEPAARRLQGLGYSAVHLLETDARGSGLGAWRAGGGELFRDVNVPSKAFGELVEHERQTPSLPAEEVAALLRSGADVVVLDARRLDEFQTMSIPGGTSVPGAELVLRVRDLAPDPRTRVIVNCAGRTRSLIGTQSLINAGLPNPVAALRNGTIGWTLAGLALDQGQQRQFSAGPPGHLAWAQARARALADSAGVQRLDEGQLQRWRAAPNRSTYCWDVRTPAEYADGHLPGFGSAPGGQLVQETDVFAAVRGARIVLVDGGAAADGVRAPMTAHWLAQMGWQVGWLADADPADFTETGPGQPPALALPDVPLVDARTLAQELGIAPDAEHAAEPSSAATRVLDLSTSAQHAAAHLPGAHWALASQLGTVLAAASSTTAASTPATPVRWVLACQDGRLSAWAAAQAGAETGPGASTGTGLRVLQGGLAAWRAAGLPVEAGTAGLLSPRIDRYRRPYEGTDAPRAAMQAYLDWEFGLVGQLAADGTHRFAVLPAA